MALICGCASMISIQPGTTAGAEGHDRVVELISSLDAHADGGVTAVDMGDIYPGVEETVGVFVQRRLQRQIASREIGAESARARMQLNTKFVPDEKLLGEIDQDYVRRVVQRSCNRLGVDFVDLVRGLSVLVPRDAYNEKP